MAALPPPPVSPDERRRRNDACWADDANWNRFMYFCKDDDRLFVPKRGRWSYGWTINFGAPAGPWVLLGIVVGVPLLQSGATAISAYYADACRGPRSAPAGR